MAALTTEKRAGGLVAFRKPGAIHLARTLDGALVALGTQEVRPTMLKIIKQFSRDTTRNFSKRTNESHGGRHDTTRMPSLNYSAPP